MGGQEYTPAPCRTLHPKPANCPRCIQVSKWILVIQQQYAYRKLLLQNMLKWIGTQDSSSIAEQFSSLLGGVPSHHARLECISQTQQTEVQNGGGACRKRPLGHKPQFLYLKPDLLLPRG